jgi:hypothetical protein
MFNFVLAGAITGYCAQGSTLPHAIVDLHPPDFARQDNMAVDLYVLLSRLVSFRGLSILRPFPKHILQHQRPSKMLEEITRLDKLAADYKQHQNLPVYTPLTDDPRDPRCGCTLCTAVAPHDWAPPADPTPSLTPATVAKVSCLGGPDHGKCEKDDCRLPSKFTKP